MQTVLYDNEKKQIRQAKANRNEEEMRDYLPIDQEDMKKRGWDQVDFVYVCGDAYVDHPSFGMAIITRVLEAHGFRIGIIAQPDWKQEESIQVFGRPRLGFLVSDRKSVV